VTGDGDNPHALKPKRVARWERTPDGRAVVFVPRIRASRLAKFLPPLLQRAEYRARLDVLGSHIWDRCDGTSTVLEIAASVWVRFGGDREAINERVAAIVRQLEHDGFITMEKGGASAPPAQG
jgi:hypothetical protein